MSEYDFHSNMDSRVALSSQLIDTDTTSVGEIIDIKEFETYEDFLKWQPQKKPLLLTY